MLDIISCKYTLPDGSGWMLERMGSRSLLTKLSGGKKRLFGSGPKKELSVDIILNLKMFFRDLAPLWEGLAAGGVPHGSIELAFSDEKFVLPSDALIPEDQKSVFDDVARYFESVFSGTYKECSLELRSFDGGGPEYRAVSDGSGVFTWSAQKEYGKNRRKVVDGAPYSMNFTFWPLRPGEGSCVITGTSPIVPATERKVIITVDGSLSSECAAGEETETGGPDWGDEYPDEDECMEEDE
ncbi:MAG: hypothetical protein J6252_04290 [Clostridia bacterium]|nr:hypothetical protein [Clostridia bacterium]